MTHAGGIAPVFSPDSTRILFSRPVTPPGEKVPNEDLFVIDRDLTGLRRITGARGDDIAGGWSPDGRRVILTRNAFGDHPSVWTMNLDGTGLRKVADDAKYPVWSQDGWVAYVKRGARGIDQVAIRSAGVPGVERVVTSNGFPATGVALQQRVAQPATSG